MLLPIIKEAADLVGGIPALAKELGIARQALYLWKQVPSKRVIQIEGATGGKISREQLRPDLYPPRAA